MSIGLVGPKKVLFMSLGLLIDGKILLSIISLLALAAAFFLMSVRDKADRSCLKTWVYLFGRIIFPRIRVKRAVARACTNCLLYVGIF